MYHTIGQTIENARLNGGGTYNIRFSSATRQFEAERFDFTTGYMVSTSKGIENLPGLMLTADALNLFVLTYALDSIDSVFYLGLWQDEAGNWSIDRSLHLREENLDKALDLAKQYGQRAIWDCNAEEEVIV
jgi:hypothetical protein